MADLVIPQFIIDVIIIAISFVALNWASNLVITNALKVSTITRLGKSSVGFTLIAMTTTLPELTVAIIALISGGSSLSVGNVLGSNIFNISVIIGLAAVILYVKSRRKSARATDDSVSFNVMPSFAKAELSNIEFGLFISSLVPMVLIYIVTASWVVGLILIFIFVSYMYQLSKVRVPPEECDDVNPAEKNKLRRYVIFTIIGALGVVLSANFLVDSAIGIAESIGIPQTVIGATIIAAGTSLPELTIGLKSVIKGHSGLAFGNIIGASFVNTTLILGITFFAPVLLGTPMSMNMSVYQNIVTFSIITNLFFWYFLSKEKIAWKEGIVFLFIYALFIATTLGAV